MRSCTIVLWGTVGLWIWTASAVGGPCAPWVSLVVSIQGIVEVKRLKESGWTLVKLQDQFCAGDSVRADIHSRAGLLLRNETLLRLDQGTTLILPELVEEDSAWLNLLRGALHFISNIPYRLKVKTPFVNAAIEGTEFAVRVSDTDTRVWVVEGEVLVENPQGSIRLGPGKAALAEAGKAPVPFLKITPRDAVQWALYYPPIIDYQPGAAGDPERQRAINLYRTGQIPAAIETLNSIPDNSRDSRFFTQRAAILLTVGEVESARSDIEQALALAPKSGTPVALQSIIALTRNDKEQALSLAEKAVKLEPESPTPRVALSYARQAAFDIEGAKESIEKALELSPNDPLAWARLSELELSTGELDEALEAAQKAEVLDPELSHTQMVLGFARLLQIDIDEAKETFNKAIELDPSAPLPRLGLGLAKIRQGDVEEGTKDIEVAAVLDPENSLVRSYLGKAYYEEKRGNVASREFEIAKKLDPNDPTPWFYDAIHKQTTNRPVEALHDMQKAIELNDNRAVYRSSLHLDGDLAARSANLGRIYKDLGFEQLGLVEGWKSVNTDPGNYSAHRFLADNYAALPRHEVARVSELLQSQLLQPINITPVQALIGERNVLALNGFGPADPSFNEFNPLFARNRLALQASGIVGTNDTYGDEVTQSGLWNNFSYSLGQFHYETKGFRENNDLKQDIYNVFAQVAVTPNLNLQAEYRNSETRHGDILLQTDPDIFDPSFRRIDRRESIRFGSNYALATHSNIIVSEIYQDLREDQSRNTFDTNSTSKGYTTEAKYLFNSTYIDLSLGAGYYDLKNGLFILVDTPRTLFPSPETFDTTHGNVYLYSYIRYPTSVTWTLGVSYDTLIDGAIGKFKQVNPKIGAIWNITPSTTLRLAVFRNLKRARFEDVSIEDTQVAGFNQTFDDQNGTEAWRYGIALNQKFTASINGGIEVSKRDLRVPFFGIPFGSAQETIFENWEEDLIRAYLYWTPTHRWAVSADYELENFDRQESPVLQPFDTTTQFLPIQLSYFDPSGFFGMVTTTYVNQKVELFTSNERDEFALVDVGIGYRLPKRYGIINFGIKNLFDKSFKFQEPDQFRERQGRPARFLPERSVFMNFTLAM